MLLLSPLLQRAGFRHGFSTRRGGVSKFPFENLNLSGRVGDEPSAVAENLRRFQARAGSGAIRTAKQVHGKRVLQVRMGEPRGEESADALFVIDKISVGVFTADCVPILLGDPLRGSAAAIHAGWRGTIAEIALAVIEVFVANGSEPRDLVAAIGPAIGSCCYEVSPELAERFRARFGDGVAPGTRLDLPLANRLLLEEAGLPAASIDTLAACTACDAERFFSHRRDRGRTGRQLSFITGRFLDSPTASF